MMETEFSGKTEMEVYSLKAADSVGAKSPSY
jgi:hypothetical protein